MKDEGTKLMWEALREAVDEEMERDPNVCIMGEDVGHYGGSYKARARARESENSGGSWCSWIEVLCGQRN